MKVGGNFGCNLEFQKCLETDLKIPITLSADCVRGCRRHIKIQDDSRYADIAAIFGENPSCILSLSDACAVVALKREGISASDGNRHRIIEME